jgi:PAS domain-containing protein
MWHEVTLKRAVIGGEPRVLAFMRDVTARRQAEQRLRASEARYRLLFEMESDAIMLAAAQTLQILDANRAALALYGYTREQLLGCSWRDLSVEPWSGSPPAQPAGTIRRLDQELGAVLAAVAAPLGLARVLNKPIEPIELRDALRWCLEHETTGTWIR